MANNLLLNLQLTARFSIFIPKSAKMKNHLSLIAIFITLNRFSQKKAILKSDTLFYNDHKFHVGDTLRFGYGSNPDKSFSFVIIGLGLGDQTNAASGWSKTEVIVDKIYKQGSKFYLKVKGDAKRERKNFYVDVEGAIDNKELLLE